MDVDGSLRQRDNEKIRGIVEVGSEVLGSSAGATLGFLMGGSIGAVAGGAGGPIVARAMRGVAVEFCERVLGQREKHRVSMTINYATAKIQKKARTR